MSDIGITIGTVINTLILDGQDWVRKGHVNKCLQPIKNVVEDTNQGKMPSYEDYYDAMVESLKLINE
jgi:hypothetical protein